MKFVTFMSQKKRKIALITGISGQDGSYLADFLLKKNYIVIGTKRRSKQKNNWRLKRLSIEKKIIYEFMDLNKIHEIEKVFNKYKFSEVYNLAAQSSVGTSFKSPLNTAITTSLGTLRILETIKSTNPRIKFYQASSSEMFGDTIGIRQDEKTDLNPKSPYGISKVMSHHLTINYRNSYNIFAVSGILFNHESPLRGIEFVTRKIISSLVKILNNDLQFFELGNIYSNRDWGYAKEYVEAMWLMLQQKKPKDFVIATGKNYTIKEFINLSTVHLGFRTKWIGKGYNEKLINKDNGKVIIKINKNLFRPSEINYSKGVAKKAFDELKWKPKTSLKKLVKIMIDDEIKYYRD